jgi:hypothetical protein
MFALPPRYADWHDPDQVFDAMRAFGRGRYIVGQETESIFARGAEVTADMDLPDQHESAAHEQEWCAGEGGSLDDATGAGKYTTSLIQRGDTCGDEQSQNLE